MLFVEGGGELGQVAAGRVFDDHSARFLCRCWPGRLSERRCGGHGFEECADIRACIYSTGEKLH
jgi:hypothetical protein